MKAPNPLLQYNNDNINDTLNQTLDGSNNATQEDSSHPMHIQSLSPNSNSNSTNYNNTIITIFNKRNITNANTGHFSDDNEKNRRALEALKQNYFNFQSRAINQTQVPLKAHIKHQPKTKYNKRKGKIKTNIRNITTEALDQLENEVRMLRKIKNDMECIDGKRKCKMLNRFLIETIPDRLSHMKDSLVYLDNSNSNNNKSNDKKESDSMLSSIDEIDNADNNNSSVMRDSGADDNNNENISKEYIREVKRLVEGYKDLNDFYNKTSNNTNTNNKNNRFNSE